jgi:hypothetical protein
MFRRSVPAVKSTLIKSRCGSDTPPGMPDGRSVIELREESYGCSGRSESKEIDRVAQPLKQHHIAISVSILRRLGRSSFPPSPGTRRLGARTQLACRIASEAFFDPLPRLCGKLRSNIATDPPTSHRSRVLNVLIVFPNCQDADHTCLLLVRRRPRLRSLQQAPGTKRPTPFFYEGCAAPQ